MSWTGTSGPITNNTGRPARTGSWKPGSAATARRDRDHRPERRGPLDGDRGELSFWLRTDTAETGSTVYDTMKVQVVSGSTTTTLATYSNVGHQRHVHPEVVQPDGLQGQDGHHPVHHDRGLLPADQLRRRRHLGQHELTLCRPAMGWHASGCQPIVMRAFSGGRRRPRRPRAWGAHQGPAWLRSATLATPLTRRMTLTGSTPRAQLARARRGGR